MIRKKIRDHLVSCIIILLSTLSLGSLREVPARGRARAMSDLGMEYLRTVDAALHAVIIGRENVSDAEQDNNNSLSVEFAHQLSLKIAAAKTHIDTLPSISISTKDVIGKRDYIQRRLAIVSGKRE
jgi:hypothetical protein